MLLCERETRRALVCSKADIEDHPVFFLLFFKTKSFSCKYDLRIIKAVCLCRRHNQVYNDLIPVIIIMIFQE